MLLAFAVDRRAWLILVGMGADFPHQLPSAAPAVQAKEVSAGERAAPRIFLSAGEASGDAYGAEIAAGLCHALPGVALTGLGGHAMRQAGQRQIVRAEDVAVMGITEILRHIPKIYRSYWRLVRSIRAERPDAAILIDFPDVNFRLAGHLWRAGVPVVWFVSPQLWAWKRRRLRWVQSRVNRMLVIFPFEEPFYRARGVEASFVGHPLAAQSREVMSRDEYAAHAREIAQEQLFSTGAAGAPKEDGRSVPRSGAPVPDALDPAKPWIALLPGSRISEIISNLPGLVDTAHLLGPGYEYLVPIAPTITPQQLRRVQHQLGRQLAKKPDPPRIAFVRDARAALTHARASVVASGTATIQAAIAGNPFVVVYRVSPLTYHIARRLVRYPAELPAEQDAAGNLPIAMVNLIAGRRVVPELINRQFTGERVAAELKPLLQDGPAREQQIEALAEVRRRLAAPEPGVTSTQRVVDEVLALLRR